MFAPFACMVIEFGAPMASNALNCGRVLDILLLRVNMDLNGKG